MEDMEKKTAGICRTCLGKIDVDSNFEQLSFDDLSGKSSSFQQKMQDFLPDLDLQATTSPMVCNECSTVILSAYKFIKKYVRTKVHILAYQRRTNQPSVDLTELVYELTERSTVIDLTLDNESKSSETVEQDIPAFNANTKETSASEQSRTAELASNTIAAFNVNCSKEFERFKQAQDTTAIFSVPNSVESSVESDAAMPKTSSVTSSLDATGDVHRELASINNKSVKAQNSQTTFKIKAKRLDNIIKSCMERTYFNCNYCSYHTNLESALVLHVVDSHGIPMQNQLTSQKLNVLFEEEFHDCPLCPFRTSSITSLSSHIEAHNSNFPYGCEKCEYRTDNKIELGIHLIDHRELGVYRCYRCFFSSKYKFVILDHLSTHTIKDEPFKCDLCGYSTHKEYYFDIHRRGHQLKKSYRCDVCPYICKSRAQLFNHNVSHSMGKVLYRCLNCQYVTFQKARLLIHEATHDAKMSFDCHKCAYSTTDEASLEMHVRNCQTSVEEQEIKETHGKVSNANSEAMEVDANNISTDLYAREEANDTLEKSDNIIQQTTTMN